MLPSMHTFNLINESQAHKLRATCITVYSMSENSSFCADILAVFSLPFKNIITSTGVGAL